MSKLDPQDELDVIADEVRVDFKNHEGLSLEETLEYLRMIFQMIIMMLMPQKRESLLPVPEVNENNTLDSPEKESEGLQLLKLLAKLRKATKGVSKIMVQIFQAPASEEGLKALIFACNIRNQVASQFFNDHMDKDFGNQLTDEVKCLEQDAAHLIQFYRDRISARKKAGRDSLRDKKGHKLLD